MVYKLQAFEVSSCFEKKIPRIKNISFNLVITFDFSVPGLYLELQLSTCIMRSI